MTDGVKITTKEDVSLGELARRAEEASHYHKLSVNSFKA